jgi:hypothetical protein
MSDLTITALMFMIFLGSCLVIYLTIKDDDPLQ